MNLISTYAIYALNSEFTTVSSPLIYEGPNGSIDIIWENGNNRLGINVPEDINSPISYYGDDRNQDFVKGAISDFLKIKKGLLDILLNFQN